jgi:starch synthase
VPDIIHCHDWHTGSLPNLLRTVYKKDPILENIATLFTIHNLAFQGTFDHKHVTQLDYDDGKSQIADFFSPRLSNQNFMRRGILYSDVVNTVSKTYSKEILTPEFGEGLDKLLLELRGKIFGIVNGIDYDEFNPATDDLIEQTFSADSLDLRAINKKALQREFDLPVNPNAFLLGFVGRLDYMKGVDLLVHSLYPALKEFDMQFVQVGGGDWSIVEMLQNLKRDFPKQVGIHTFPNFTLPRLLFSGCDSIVYPSRFEPCGIVQIEAMRYGAVPVVRKVGGLADTVENFHSDTLKGNGFIFDYFNEFSLFGQLIRASELFKNKEIWHQLQKNAMQSDFSWEYSAREYVKLYEKVYAFKHNKSPREKSLDYDLLM